MDLEAIYCGDDWPNRRKSCGLTLIDQFFLSAMSVRQNWPEVGKIKFFHTLPLSRSIRAKMRYLCIETIKASRSIEPSHLMANKILPVLQVQTESDQIFLDCDTIVHRAPNIERTSEMLVSYDAISPMPKSVYADAFSLFQLPVPPDPIHPAPAQAFYENPHQRQFPCWNAGVFYLRADKRQRFYREYLKAFRRVYPHFSGSDHAFYCETLAFTVAAYRSALKLSIFEPGVNFICTPRAPAQLSWPRSRVFIEHYAGNTSRPLDFDGERIIPYW